MTNNTHSIHPSMLTFILFFEGLVSVSLQIIFIRQLTPFVGGDVTVVGIVIGVYLTALSLGYFQGGKRGGDIAKLSRNLIYSALWSGIFMSYYVMSLWFDPAVHLSIDYSSLVIYLLVGLFPVVYWLGHTVPILVDLIKKDKASNMAGISLGVNTIGSVLGAVITPIVFFDWLGVAATIFIYCTSLVMLYLLSQRILNRLTIATVMTTLPLLVIVYWLNVMHGNDRFVKTTAYANYAVNEVSDNYGNHISIMQLNNSAASVIENGHHMGYVRYLYNYMIDQLRFTDHDVLVLGAGGFTFSMKDSTDNRYTYVDIDPDIKSVAEKFFLKFEIKGDFIAEDARHFVGKNKARYDAIFVDLFSHNINMPWHVTTQSFIQDVSEALKPEGYALFNVIQHMGFENEDNRRLHNTIQSVFDYCYITPLYNQQDIYANVVYMCKKPSGSIPEINIDNRHR